MKDFPKTLYVKIEHDREPEDDFFIASGDVSDLSESESTIPVAEYKLVRLTKVINRSNLVD